MLLAAIWTVLALVAMTSGTQLNWPDFVHVNYGYPLRFAVHTLNTIAGPVDKWSLDLDAFLTDISVWFIGLLVIFVGMVGYLLSTKKTPQ